MLRVSRCLPMFVFFWRCMYIVLFHTSSFSFGSTRFCLERPLLFSFNPSLFFLPYERVCIVIIVLTIQDVSSRRTGYPSVDLSSDASRRPSLYPFLIPSLIRATYHIIDTDDFHDSNAGIYPVLTLLIHPLLVC